MSGERRQAQKQHRILTDLEAEIGSLSLIAGAEISPQNKAFLSALLVERRVEHEGVRSQISGDRESLKKCRVKSAPPAWRILGYIPSLAAELQNLVSGRRRAL